jgi:hypothetical protein
MTFGTLRFAMQIPRHDGVDDYDLLVSPRKEKRSEERFSGKDNLEKGKVFHKK